MPLLVPPLVSEETGAEDAEDGFSAATATTEEAAKAVAPALASFLLAAW